MEQILLKSGASIKKWGNDYKVGQYTSFMQAVLLSFKEKLFCFFLNKTSLNGIESLRQCLY